jgi:hypothetical protein
MPYRDQAFVLAQRIRDVDAERDALVLQLAALRPPAWQPAAKRPKLAALVGAVVVTLASLPAIAQLARVELVTPAGRHTFLFSGQYGTERLTVSLRTSEHVVSSATGLERKITP